MAKPKVFVTRRLPGTALRKLDGRVDFEVFQGEEPPPRDALIAGARGCDGLLTLLTDRVDDALLAECPRLKVVSNMAVGYDNIDVGACVRRGVQIGNTPGVLTETSADLAFALLLAAARRIVEGADLVRAGGWKTWDPNLLLGRDVHGATLGIAGLGKIGKAVARRAHAFGMRILYTHKADAEAEARWGARLVSRETLLAESDYLSLHLPLNASTRHYLDAAALARMKPSAMLVNTARGGVVDQRALLEALDAGRPAFAAVDVTDPEPPAPDDPILHHPRVLVVPHIGSATEQTRGLMADMAVENLLAGVEGRPLPNEVRK